MRKKWKKPELVILARLKRGESVLQGCKTASRAAPGTSPCFPKTGQKCHNEMAS